MRALGLRTFLQDEDQAPIIVTFHAPVCDGYSFRLLYETVREDGFILYPGKLTRIDTFRVGCIGCIDESVISRAVAAVGATLATM